MLMGVGKMATPPSDDTRTLFKLISDGEWHRYEEIRDRIAEKVPPGRALRKYQERIEYKRKYSGDPTYDTSASEDERIELGAKACAQVVITSWKGRGIQHREHAGQKWIRVRPGFRSWGLEAEGILGPGSADSEPSEERADGPQEASLPEPVAEPFAGVLHPSHESVTVDTRSFATTCPACGELVVSGGQYGGVTPAGKDPCRAGSVSETVTVSAPEMQIIAAAESDFLVRIDEAVGDASVRSAIARADQMMSAQGMTPQPPYRTVSVPGSIFAGVRSGGPEPDPEPVVVTDPPPLRTVSDEPSVTDRREQPESRPALPDAAPVSQDPEMALFRESDMRHLISEEVAKTIDGFQLGMQQYLADQFEQLSQQIALLQTRRGKWTFHPFKE